MHTDALSRMRVTQNSDLFSVLLVTELFSVLLSTVTIHAHFDMSCGTLSQCSTSSCVTRNPVIRRRWTGCSVLAGATCSMVLQVSGSVGISLPTTLHDNLVGSTHSVNSVDS